MKDDNEKKQGGLSDIDPKMLARIQSLRLMDDDFMTVVFSSDKKLTELLNLIDRGSEKRILQHIEQSKQSSPFAVNRGYKSI